VKIAKIVYIGSLVAALALLTFTSLQFALAGGAIQLAPTNVEIVTRACFSCPGTLPGVCCGIQDGLEYAPLVSSDKAHDKDKMFYCDPSTQNGQCGKGCPPPLSCPYEVFGYAHGQSGLDALRQLVIRDFSDGWNICFATPDEAAAVGRFLADHGLGENDPLPCPQRQGGYAIGFASQNYTAQVLGYVQGGIEPAGLIHMTKPVAIQFVGLLNDTYTPLSYDPRFNTWLDTQDAAHCN